MEFYIAIWYPSIGRAVLYRVVFTVKVICVLCLYTLFFMY